MQVLLWCDLGSPQFDVPKQLVRGREVLELQGQQPDLLHSSQLQTQPSDTVSLVCHDYQDLIHGEFMELVLGLGIPQIFNGKGKFPPGCKIAN